MSSALTSNARLARRNYPQRDIVRHDVQLDIGLKARSVILASRSMMRLRSQKRSTSELSGQSRRVLCPPRYR
jgi:hypothetical protein